ncbi:hypothetical protein RFI_32540, partial [Reticulomyxa filosa]
TLEENTNREQSASETLNVQTGGSRLSNELFYKTVTKRSDVMHELLDDVISRNNNFLFSLQKLNDSLVKTGANKDNTKKHDKSDNYQSPFLQNVGICDVSNRHLLKCCNDIIECRVYVYSTKFGKQVFQAGMNKLTLSINDSAKSSSTLTLFYYKGYTIPIQKCSVDVVQFNTIFENNKGKWYQVYTMSFVKFLPLHIDEVCVVDVTTLQTLFDANYNINQYHLI